MPKRKQSEKKSDTHSAFFDSNPSNSSKLKKPSRTRLRSANQQYKDLASKLDINQPDDWQKFLSYYGAALDNVVTHYVGSMYHAVGLEYQAQVSSPPPASVDDAITEKDADEGSSLPPAGVDDSEHEASSNQSLQPSF